MSSVWLLVSGDDAPVVEEGFHVTESSARRRAQERVAEDQAAHERAKEWLEISFEEFRGIRRLPDAYGVVEVEDVAYEIHRGGLVPDALWFLVDDDEGVDHERGYRVTAQSAQELLLSRDVAAHENWGLESQHRDEDESFREYYRKWCNNRVVRIERHDMGSFAERPSRRALELKERILAGVQVPEPMMSVRGGLTTYTWDGKEGSVVELRVAETGACSVTVHRDNQRPLVTTHGDEIVTRARWALGTTGVPLPDDVTGVPHASVVD